MSDIERAIAIAVEAHKGQQDRSGQPYIMHPLAVMSVFDDPDDQIVAVLHDVVEDTEWTLQDLIAEGFQPDVINDISLMTKRPMQPYGEYILWLTTSARAVAVKIADLEHNMSPSRLLFDDRFGKDVRRFHKYVLAHRFLTGRMDEKQFADRISELESWSQQNV